MKTITSLFAVAAVAATTALPALASADRWHDRHDRHVYRDQWKNVALASGIVGLVGAATHDSTLTAVGIGGALYGVVRYENETRHDGSRRFDRRRWDDGRRGRDRR